MLISFNIYKKNLTVYIFTTVIICALITNKLDYCNSLLYGMSNFQIQRLQKITDFLRICHKYSCK